MEEKPVAPSKVKNFKPINRFSPEELEELKKHFELYLRQLPSRTKITFKSIAVEFESSPIIISKLYR